jgi:hypothetical protein
MSKFGLHGIGPQRWDELKAGGIPDLASFRNASLDKIQEIGNPHILEIWRKDQHNIGRTAHLSALDQAQMVCEEEVRKRTKKTLAELPRSLLTTDPSDLPGSCEPKEVRGPLSQKQFHEEWLDFIEKELTFTRQEKLKSQIFTALQKTGVTSSGASTESTHDWEIIMSDTSNVYLGNRKWWNLLFPKQRKNIRDVFFQAPSDHIAALLQALTQNRPVPKPELLHSIADHLLVLARERDMPFLLFLAQDYDKYASKPFQVSQILSLPETPANEKKEIEAAKAYFIKYGLEPLAAELTTYVANLQDPEKQREELPGLWLQVLKLDESTSDAKAKKQEAKAALLSISANYKVWAPEFFKLVKAEAVQHRSLNTFNTLMALQTALKRTLPSPVAFANIPVDTEWAQIILREGVPLEIVYKLGFKFDLAKVEEGMKPLFDKIRSSLDTETSLAQLTGLFEADDVDKTPVYQYIFKSGALSTEEDKLWALDTALALHLRRNDATKLWTNLPDEFLALLPAQIITEV